MGLHRLRGLALLAFSGAAVAGWNASPETLDGHPTWIYTPSTAMPNGRHPLLIALHGCDQTHTQLKEFGNLVPAAEAHGTVVAVPSVGNKVFGPGCWDYNGATDSKGHIAELVRLANRLKARASLQIEPSHVYIVGLSSGAAMALDVACKAPDVFAGVGAVAGPTVGSSQFIATTAQRSTLGQANVTNAISKCRSMAGSKAPQLATQVANVAFGDMDKDGAKALFAFQHGDTAHAGQYALVTVGWSEHNVQVLRELYAAGPFEAAQPVQGGLGTLRVARRDDKPRLSLLVVHDVGHAWPAGSGRPNNINDGGRWIAQSGLNYSEFVTGWLIGNNLRTVPPGTPQLTLAASVPAPQRSVQVTGSAHDADGSIVRLDTVLLKGSAAGAYLQVDAHSGLAVGADGSFSDRYDNLPDGRYKVRATAVDNSQHSATELSPELKVGNPPPLDECHDFTDNNFGHVMRGRALQCSFAFACAKGSGDNLGLFSLGITSTVSQTGASPGVFRKGACPQP